MFFLWKFVKDLIYWTTVHDLADLQGRIYALSTISHHRFFITRGSSLKPRCTFPMPGSFPLLSAPHSLFSIWTNLEWTEKIPGAPTRRWGEWIWLIGPCGLHRNSPQGLNISSIRVLTRSEIRKSQLSFAPYFDQVFFLLKLLFMLWNLGYTENFLCFASKPNAPGTYWNLLWN